MFTTSSFLFASLASRSFAVFFSFFFWLRLFLFASEAASVSVATFLFNRLQTSTGTITIPITSVYFSSRCQRICTVGLNVYILFFLKVSVTGGGGGDTKHFIIFFGGGVRNLPRHLRGSTKFYD